MYVIGTAGHVDHGKSTLVEALTGIDPDRLREEQEREMTIDLGFAWVTLPSGREISIVDVPGHEDFIRNMLAGAGGIDGALLVVAADESVMPQTREHLAVLDLLRVPRGVVALTKSDAVQDPDWADLVQEEVRELLEGTSLEGSPMVRVSAVTGQGLPELAAALDALLDDAPPPADLARPRLPVDRVFTIAGFGTIVTGTLAGGHVAVGDTLSVMPGGLPVRVRGLQIHKTSVQRAEPGTRLAVNLAGIDRDQIARGQVLCRPGWLDETRLLDAHLRALPNQRWPIKHNMPVEFFVGTSRTPARVRVLQGDAIAPGEQGWVQLRLRDPVALQRGDRFIVRMLSPSVTLGGGLVVDARPRRRHRRDDQRTLARLAALADGDPAAVMLHEASRDAIVSSAVAVRSSGLAPAVATQALEGLVQEGRVRVVGADSETQSSGKDFSISAADRWEELTGRMRHVLDLFYETNPLRAGISLEELRTRCRVPAGFWDAVIAAAAEQGVVEVSGSVAALAGHCVGLSEDEQHAVDAAMAAIRGNPFGPPSVGDLEATLGPALLDHLVASGSLVKLSPAIVFDCDAYRDAERRVVAYLEEHGQITLGEVRDLLGTSRKYAQALIEYLDRMRVTKRVGDARVLRR